MAKSQCLQLQQLRTYYALKMWLLMCGLVVLCCCSTSAQAWAGTGGAQVPSLILFGDSTVDVGNNNFVTTLARSDFSPYGRQFDTKQPTGRFTDGRMVGDYVATSLGLPISLPYLHPNATGERILQGANFASAAAGYLDSTSLLLNVIPLFKQLEMFHDYKIRLENLVGQQKASFLISEALYIISAGSNDFILNYYVNPSIQEQYTTTQFSSLIMSKQIDFIQQLHEAGARKIAVFGFPPIGCLPAQITFFGSVGQQGCIEDMNEVSTAYNNALQAQVPQMQNTFSDSRLVYLDCYSYAYGAFNNPSKYGYTETRRACCGEGYIATSLFCNSASEGTCSDASTYMFFDSLHPTQTVYREVADVTYKNLVSFFNL